MCLICVLDFHFCRNIDMYQLSTQFTLKEECNAIVKSVISQLYIGGSSAVTIAATSRFQCERSVPFLKHVLAGVFGKT